MRELESSGVLVQVPRFSKFLHGMALLHPGRCSEAPRWFVWDEGAGCAVPAGLEEARGISEERLALKQLDQQVGLGLCKVWVCIGLLWFGSASVAFLLAWRRHVISARNDWRGHS